MLFKKSEPRRWHPCLVITIGALSVIGAVTVANAARGMADTVKNKIKSFMQRTPECNIMQCDCDESAGQ